MEALNHLPLCSLAPRPLAESGEERKRKRKMTIVIQNVATREFLAGSNEWVHAPHDALPFDDTRKALKYCHRHELESVRLVVFLRDRKVSLLLYVPGSKAPSPSGVLRGMAA